MADNYDNGYGGDFKRNPSGGGDNDGGNGPGNTGLSEAASTYLRTLLAEKIKLSQGGLPLAVRLLDQEVERVKTEGRARPPERFVDVMRDKQIRVVVKVTVPVKDHPKFNFVGKLLGPKGNTMKQLQEETMCKMAVLGRGSMRDRQKEEELRQSLDPKYAHLSDDLHVEISALGPPAEAHARIAYALAEVRKYLVPDPPMDGGMRMPMLERGPPPMRMPPMQAHRPGPPKGKVLSILDRARVAMDDPYAYEDPYARPEQPAPRQVRAAPPQRAATTEFYYDRAADRPFAYDDDYYKPPAREYKAGGREGGARRGGGAGGRYNAREAPYNRPKQH